jgi:hypothetical protein
MIAVAAVLAVLCAAGVVVRTRIYFTVGLVNAGSEIGNLALAIQLATMVGGVIAIHLCDEPWARRILVIEGAVCLLAYGWVGPIYAAGMLAWYGLLALRWLGRARVIVAVVALAAMNACGLIGGALAANALVFSMMFTLRMLMYGWDRWQNDLERPPLFDYLFYMLPAPLVIMPPYLVIVPMFTGFAARFKPGLTRSRVKQIAKHFGLAALFGAMRGAVEVSGIDADGLSWLYGHLVASVMVAAAYAHAFIALLLLHGIDERLPLVRPLLSTRFVDYWNRYQVHQKDAQVFLFFTPAILKLRRMNRYVAIALATAWTMMVGNTLLHVATRYCFLPSIWGRVQLVLVTNGVMAIALAIEMCLDERRSRRRIAGLPVAGPPGWPRLALRWATTMTLAAIASV